MRRPILLMFCLRPKTGGSHAKGIHGGSCRIGCLGYLRNRSHSGLFPRCRCIELCPALATVAGTVEDIRTVSDASDDDGSIAYIEIRVADADATGAAAVQAEKDGSSLPEAGDTLKLIRNDHTERTYGPEPKIGDEVEAKIWHDREDAVIDGEHRAAYDICSIETYSWLIESGQRSRYPEVR